MKNNQLLVVATIWNTSLEESVRPWFLDLEKGWPRGSFGGLRFRLAFLVAFTVYSRLWKIGDHRQGVFGLCTTKIVKSTLSSSRFSRPCYKWEASGFESVLGSCSILPLHRITIHLFFVTPENEHFHAFPISFALFRIWLEVHCPTMSHLSLYDFYAGHTWPPRNPGHQILPFQAEPACTPPGKKSERSERSKG